MNRSKRNAKKPTRYKTTSSENEDNIKSAGKNKYSRKTEMITDVISRDIDDLKQVVENSSNNSYNVHNYARNANNIDMQSQPGTYIQYLTVPQEPNENTLPMFIHNTASCAINEVQIEQATASDSTCCIPSHENNGNTDVHHVPPEKKARLLVESRSSYHNMDNREVYESNDNTYTNLDVHHVSSTEKGRLLVQSRSSHNTDNREVFESLHRIEREMRKFKNILDHILKHIQKKQRRVVRKPDCLPISTVAELSAFETVDEEIYEDVHGLLCKTRALLYSSKYVSYFENVGGFSVKEAINISFKEGIKDNVTKGLTWLGREENAQPLYNSRIMLAIYDAVCNSQQFSKPTRAEFQSNAREALRSAKQRYRTSIRKPKEHEQHNIEARNYWNNIESDNEERSQSSNSISNEDD